MNKYIKSLEIVFLIIFSIIMVVEYSQTIEQKETFNTLKKQHINRKADLVFNYLDIKYDQAYVVITQIKNSTYSNIWKVYKNKEELYADMVDLTLGKVGNYKINKIFEKQIRGLTLNNVSREVAENNDPLIMIKDVIVADYSFNCSSDGKLRSAENEAKKQYSIELSKIAFNDISRYNKTYTMWHYIKENKSKYAEEIRTMNRTNIQELKEMFIKYESDMNMLKGFEFLTISRINDLKDIFGDNVLSSQGIYNNKNMQIHFIQGFNIIDQIKIDKEMCNQLKTEDNNFIELENQYYMQKSFKQFRLLILGLLIIILYIFVVNNKPKR